MLATREYLAPANLGGKEVDAVDGANETTMRLNFEQIRCLQMATASALLPNMFHANVNVGAEKVQLWCNEKKDAGWKAFENRALVGHVPAPTT